MLHELYVLTSGLDRDVVEEDPEPWLGFGNPTAAELARLAEDEGISITVCHLPPGTSKWNKIEHRLFSAISTNWRGQPFTGHEVVVNLIGSTTTRTGPSVKARLDRRHYPKGVKISKKEIEALPIEPHDFHGEWNYTVRDDDILKNASVAAPPGSRERTGLGPSGWCVPNM